MKKLILTILLIMSLVTVSACGAKKDSENTTEFGSQSASEVSSEIAADGTVKMTLLDGTVIEISSDGSTKKIQLDGTVIVTATDGTITETKVDGTVILTKTDGTKIETTVEEIAKDSEPSTEAATQAANEPATDAPASTPQQEPATDTPSPEPTPEPETDAPAPEPTPEPTTEAPANNTDTGLVYGYYTNCTTDGLNESKAEYGKHLPYEYFTVGSSPLVYCIAYVDDALSYGVRPKFNTLLGLTASMQAFSDYAKNGTVGVALRDFGDYNGRRVCVVVTGTN